MRPAVQSALQDLLAGLVAIVAVVATAVVAQFVGSDLRALFAVSGVAFFLAGLARRGHPGSPAWRQGLVVSLPGLLGDAALIVNNGLHRLEIPAAITLTSIVCAIAGVATRRLGSAARGRALGLAAVFAFALAAWVGFGLPRLLGQMAFHRVSRTTPALRFTALDGSSVRFPDPGHRVVVLAFWATWCLPCRWELPEIARVHQRFAADPRVAVWVVDVGWGPESPRRARAYMKRQGLEVPAAFDSGYSAQALGVHALPAVVVVDANGRLRLTHVGYDRSEDLAGRLSATVANLLAEPAGPPGHRP